ncbi:MAG: [FeFe] hydrogenase H-cluster maturation GTPase HydF [Desulfovibrio sp.]|jgi:[FeFe] hydrogenase H-cluster maturation GTPase HydF
MSESMNSTPRAMRLHIGIFGRRNAGKSSLVNALTAQQASIVSDLAGTTTDPVYKAMEVPGIGPCVFIDTAGYDDEGPMGQLRVRETEKALEKTDVAILVLDGTGSPLDAAWAEKIRSRGIPFLAVLNKADGQGGASLEQLLAGYAKDLGVMPLPVSARNKRGLPELFDALLRSIPPDWGRRSITGSLCAQGDTVLLVMPQDIQAPKGRLILPQVQVTRELLDKQCVVVSCTTGQAAAALAGLREAPRLIITDSQAFGEVWKLKPEQSRLTSFSVLLAGYKGDMRVFLRGAEAMDRLTGASSVLIAESCTHAPMHEDIGRVKIPRALRARYGEGMSFTMASGKDFPDDLSPFDLIIHCGGCMFNRACMMSRIRRAEQAGVPMCNYGIALAKLAGILDRLAYPEET